LIAIVAATPAELVPVLDWEEVELLAEVMLEKAVGNADEPPPY
jgi:hypothetical protein